MLQDCGASSVANQDTLGNFAELGTMTKGTMVVNLNKTNELQGRISMVRVITGDLFLKDNLVRMLREKNFVVFVGDDMHKVNVGLKVKLWL